ncbi:NUDIX hydrolase [Glycomyces sp. TRM65418]|uniref:NUDIX domain-containing protein n=1 Tax=Glycomyces sp. TRM65418 TaxID=2867006 RepID=UPI001CE68A42|nr:NUDIX hydrolase [Glycomyces sp. TRM65418]MCC3762644.1 NUDIX hydrolase [Glycomyces sp. TRM65418]QZD56681.1 NUDIX hydrolase [Glycomyces sp. TRM65418]
MSPNEWQPPEQWVAGLPKHLASAGSLFTDSAGRILLVKPNYRDHWLLVGGLLNEGESPEQACRREVKEEIGIDLPPGRLLLVDWTPPSSARPLPLIEFIFEGDTIEPHQVKLDTGELDEHRFTPPEQAMSLLSNDGQRRLTDALRAQQTGTTLYRSGVR